MSLTHHFSSLWAEGRTRFSKQLENLQENDLRKTLPPAPNSAGFLIRHLADVELLFARNVFKFADVQVHAKTVIAQRDTGEWTNLQELLDYQQKAADTLKKAIFTIPDSSWDQTITTNEFGTKTLAEALGRIITHTAYHAGQLALILKYGTIPAADL